MSGFSAFFKQGGGEAEAASLCKCLASHGLAADLYGPNASELETYDFVIYFSCHPSGEELLESAFNLGIKFIFWPNFWVGQDWQPGGDVVRTVDKYCEFADRIVFKSETELTLFRKYFTFNRDKVLRINWFIDSDFLSATSPEQFKELYGLSDYLLSVGLIEPVKNQLALINATRLAGKQLVLIGGIRHNNYFEECMKASGGHVVCIPHQPVNSPILKAAYSGCETYVEVSLDPPGRSALEAAYFDRPLVLSRSDWANEIFLDAATLVDPTNVEDIQSALEGSTNLGRQDAQWKKIFPVRYLPDFALAYLYKYLDSTKGRR